MIEIDRFTTMAATHGVNAAQEAIRGIARISLSQVRAEDLICRYTDSKIIVLVNGAESRRRVAGGRTPAA